MPLRNGDSTVGSPQQSAEHGSDAGAAKEQVQQKAQDAAAVAQQKAQQLGGELQGRLRQQLDRRSSQASEQISERAQDLRTVSAALRDQGKEGPATAAEQLAGYTERAGTYLRDKDAGAMLADFERFGRGQPWAVAGCGLVLGMAAARLLKASSGQRYRALTVARPRGVYPTPEQPTQPEPASAPEPSGLSQTVPAEPLAASSTV